MHPGNARWKLLLPERAVNLGWLRTGAGVQPTSLPQLSQHSLMDCADFDGHETQLKAYYIPRKNEALKDPP